MAGVAAQKHIRSAVAQPRTSFRDDGAVPPNAVSRGRTNGSVQTTRAIVQNMSGDVPRTPERTKGSSETRSRTRELAVGTHVTTFGTCVIASRTRMTAFRRRVITVRRLVIAVSKDVASPGRRRTRTGWSHANAKR